MSRRVALVTGGGQGIGKACVRRLLEEGFAVVCAELDEEAGKETAKEFHGIGEIRFIQTDVSNEEMVRSAVGAAINTFGRLDVLLNNAGIFVNKPIEVLSIDEWNRVISVNLTGVFLFSKYASNHLRKTNGAIVNIASTRAFMSEPNTEAYSASKGGVFALTHALAVSLGPEVKVNCISPGWIDVGEWKKSGVRHKTELSPQDHAQHPAGRVGIPEDVASLVLFLVSREASFITGANFMIDGGMTRKMIYV